jgi:hypothetical protein
LKVIGPNVGARIEQLNNLACDVVKARNIWTLLEIAMWATPAKIYRVVVTAVLLGDNVIDVKRQEWFEFVRQAAILTPVFCPIADKIA